MTDKGSHTLQMLLSLVVATVIVILAIAWTTSQMPLDRLPREQKEELQKDAEDRRDDKRDAREDAREERDDGSGS